MLIRIERLLSFVVNLFCACVGVCVCGLVVWFGFCDIIVIKNTHTHPCTHNQTKKKERATMKPKPKTTTKRQDFHFKWFFFHSPQNHFSVCVFCSKTTSFEMKKTKKSFLFVGENSKHLCQFVQLCRGSKELDDSF
jgi:hypothetical protein